MKSLNQVQLIGNLTKDPEIKQVASGNSVSTFSLAMNRSVKNGDNWEEVTDYADCVAWGRIAEMIHEFVSKGQKLFVQGRLQTRSYEKDGNKKYVTEVVVSDVVFMDSKKDTSESSQSQHKPKDVILDDIGDGSIDLSRIPF